MVTYFKIVTTAFLVAALGYFLWEWSNNMFWKRMWLYEPFVVTLFHIFLPFFIVPLGGWVIRTLWRPFT